MQVLKCLSPIPATFVFVFKSSRAPQGFAWLFVSTSVSLGESGRLIEAKDDVMQMQFSGLLARHHPPAKDFMPRDLQLCDVLALLKERLARKDNDLMSVCKVKGLSLIRKWRENGIQPTTQEKIES